MRMREWLELAKSIGITSVTNAAGSMRRRDRNVSFSSPEANAHTSHLMLSLDELRSVVVDGVTVGHPCCTAHDCPIPLESSRDRYCPAHAHLSSLCVAISCNETTEANFKTCTDPDHRNLETRYSMAAKAMFQLRHRLERVNRQTHDSLPTDFASDGDGDDFEGSSGRDDQEVEVTADDCNGKPSSGNRTIRARFCRRRTHNDELCVASCGVILGRKTFYGSEAPSAVRVCSFRSVLPPTHLQCRLS